MLNGGNINVFNFDEPMHGDIFGFVLERGDCDDDCCDKQDEEQEYSE